MIERFNFYDVYGYFIPGSVIILAIWLPFTMTGHIELPSGEWPLLIVGVLLAYLAGHLLQTMASTAIPSSKNVTREKWRYPSALMVSSDDSTLTDTTKKRIEKCVRSWFGIDIQVWQMGSGALGKLRQDAFELSRRVVVKSGNYAEQFQGLYVMMRGIAAAFWLATPYMAGWALGAWCNMAAYYVSAGILIASIVAFLALSFRHIADLEPIKRLSASRLSLGVLGAGLLCIGYICGVNKMTQVLAYEFGAIAIFYLGVGVRAFASCQYFAREFAKAVWVQFAASPVQRPER